MEGISFWYCSMEGFGKIGCLMEGILFWKIGCLMKVLYFGKIWCSMEGILFWEDRLLNGRYFILRR